MNAYALNVVASFPVCVSQVLPLIPLMLLLEGEVIDVHIFGVPRLYIAFFNPEF